MALKRTLFPSGVISRQTRANNATLKLGNGAVTALSAAGSVHLILDVSGYFQ